MAESMELNSSSGNNLDESHPAVQHTNYTKSLRHYLTREALPKEQNYRNLESIVTGNGKARPTLDDLHENTYRDAQRGVIPATEDPEQNAGSVLKFGWIKGVFMRCLLNIWGVMLFLRVSWMVGQSGLLQALGIVVVSNVVTTITSLSMSAIASNGQISGGGVYYMISRSLGPQFGGAIGLMFTLANSIAVATYIIGFVDSLGDLLREFTAYMSMTGNLVNDIRVIGSITLVAIMVIAVVGMQLVTMVQQGLLVLLIIAQLCFVCGAIIGPMSNNEVAQGFVGFNSELFYRNLWSAYEPSPGSTTPHSFFSVFAVFFPAVTGIVAGANLSGDLKNPASAIPKGTLLAIFTTFITYMAYPFLLAGTMVRHANGDTEALIAFKESPGFLNGSLTILDAPTFGAENCPAEGCTFGTINNFQVLALMSPTEYGGIIIYLGCFAATISSAIASLVGAPRVLQALSKDKLYPYISKFADTWGRNKDPVNGYLLTFVLALLCIMVGDLNAVSTILSNFFLASYFLINLSCFHASLMGLPSHRPAFKYYNHWLSLLGAFCCIGVMFAIDYKTALLTAVCMGALYLYVTYRNPQANWGSTVQAQVYTTALKSLHELTHVGGHVKLYRINAIAFVGNPYYRPSLVHFAKSITANNSLLILGNYNRELSYKQRLAQSNRCSEWMKKNHVKGFYQAVEADNLDVASKSIFQSAGLGNLRPNTCIVGFKNDWRVCSAAELTNYFQLIHNAFDNQLAVVVLRMTSGLDYSRIIENEDSALCDPAPEPPALPTPANPEGADTLADEHTGSEASTPPGSPTLPPHTPREEDPIASKEDPKKKRRSSISSLYHGPGGQKLPKEIQNEIAFFQRKHKKGTIDVWWLYDDGGLTLLLPWLLTTRQQYSEVSLRILTLANRKAELDVEQRNMAKLLSKFRINFSDLIIVPEAMKKPKLETRAEFDEMLKDHLVADDVNPRPPNTVTEAELAAQELKTDRHLRVRELMLENSRDATLIAMTLPMPRKTQVPAPLFMAWVDFISHGMPPFVFVRGNQESVLTFYC